MLGDHGPLTLTALGGTRSACAPASPDGWSTPGSVAFALTSPGTCPGSTRRVHGRSSPAAWERSRTTGSSTPARSRRRCVMRTGKSLRSGCSVLPTRSTTPVSRVCGRGVSSEPVQIGVGLFRRVDLPGCLRNGPSPRFSVDRDDGPPATVLVAEVDEQRLVVVLDPESMGRVARLMEDPRWFGERIGHERRPPPSSLGAVTAGQRRAGHRHLLHGIAEHGGTRIYPNVSARSKIV